jgi:hypothetical protein
MDKIIFSDGWRGGVPAGRGIFLTKDDANHAATR